MDINPKTYRQNKSKGTRMSFDFASIISPINAEIKDPKEILETFRKWPLIPYSGTARGSAHGLLAFLDSARFISPTQGAIHESIKSYVFANKLRVVSREDSDFDLDDDMIEPSIERQKSLVDYLRGNLTIANNLTYTQLGEHWFDSLKDNGNYFIEIVHAETLEVKSTKVFYHPTSSCCYWATNEGEPMFIAISSSFDHNYLEKNPPKLVPTYPNYKKEKDGEIYRTIVHVKNGNFKYYGRPDWVAAWQSVYREYQDDDYLVKMAANQFTGQVFIELEDDDVGESWDNDDAAEEGFSGVVDRIEKNFTAKGNDPQTVMVTSRPYGSKNAFIYQFKPVTDAKFLNSNANRARQRLIENNQWSERLLGNAVSEGFQSDAYESELGIKSKSVLKRYRGKIDYGWSIILRSMMIFAEVTEFDDLDLSIGPKPKAAEVSSQSVKETADAYGTAVRAGSITPNIEDETFFRETLGINPPNEFTNKAWREDGNFRRPVTLKGSETSVVEKNKNE